MNQVSWKRAAVLFTILGVAILMTPVTAEAYIICYGYGPGGIILGPCPAGMDEPPGTCSVVPYDNGTGTHGQTPGLQTRFVELGSDDFDAIAITLPDGSNRTAFPKGAPAKGTGDQTLQNLFLAADTLGDGSEESVGDGVFLIFDKGVLDGLSPDGATVKEILGLAGSARSVTGYYTHR